jgi:hypothetical protein
MSKAKSKTENKAAVNLRPGGIAVVGSVIIYAGGAGDPDRLEAFGWMVCDGRSLSTMLYPQLFSAIGYSYGGSGNEFNIPKLPAPFAPIAGGAYPGLERALYIICFVSSIFNNQL